MKTNGKNILATIVLLSLLLSIVACGTTPSGNNPTTNTEIIIPKLTDPIDEGPYYYEAQLLPEMAEAFGDTPYMIRNTGTTQSGGYIFLSYFDEKDQQSDHLFLISASGECQEKIDLKENIGTSAEEITSVTSDHMGNIHVLTSSGKQGPTQEGTYSIHLFDTNGEKKENPIHIGKNTEEERDILRYNGMHIDRQEKIYLFATVTFSSGSYKAVDIFDRDGTFLSTIREDYENPQTAVQFMGTFIENPDGVYIGSYPPQQTGLHYYRLDPETQKADTGTPLLITEDMPTVQQGHIYQINSTGFYRYTSNGQEKIPQFTWEELKLSFEPLNKCIVLSDEWFLVGTRARRSTNVSFPTLEWRLLQKTPGERTIVEKKVLTVGGMSPQTDLYMIRAKELFELQYPEYRLEFIDYYNEEEGYEVSLQRMKLDLLSGKTQDIIYSDANLDFKRISERGAFYELSSFIYNDPTFFPEKYAKFLFQQAKDSEDIYFLFPSYSTKGIGTRIETYNQFSEWSIYEFENYIENYDGEARPFLQLNHMRFWEPLATIVINKRKDLLDESLYSPSGELAQALLLAQKYGIDGPGEDNLLPATELANNRILFDTDSGQLVDIAQWCQDWFNSNGNITRLPIPSYEVNKEMLLEYYSITSFAITETSTEKEMSWNFMKILLDEDLQKEVTWGFPVSTEALNYVIDRAKIYSRYPLDDKGAQELRNILSRVSESYEYDWTVTEILLSESQAFFSGDKTLEQTLDIVKNKISTYIKSQ